MGISSTQYGDYVMSCKYIGKGVLCLKNSSSRKYMEEWVYRSTYSGARYV
jgi:hypothetical protein